MSDGAGKSFIKKPVSLLILEGDTEEIFYPIIRDRFLSGIKIKLRNIKGQRNINKDIASEIYKYTYNNTSDYVRAYCCIDSTKQEISATPFDPDLVNQKIIEQKMNLVLSVDAIIAEPEIESWFFYDIEGIFKHLRANPSGGDLGRYKNPRNLCKKDLQQLFHRLGKEYISGYRAANFIKNLNVCKIASNCEELRDGIEKIKSQSCDLANHIFRQ